MTALIALAVALLLMLAELRVSKHNEQVLRNRGATEPPDPVYPTMRWAYPGMFVGMALEGALTRSPDVPMLVSGLVVFVVAKALKVWAIRSLGERWTYRVFVLPGSRLVTDGPYRWVRHPNYIAVVGELVGFALITNARYTGGAALLIFAELLRRRIRAEERALGLS